MTLTKRVIARIDVKGTKLIKGISFEGLRVIGEASDYAQKYAMQNIDEIFYADAVASLYGRNSLSNLLKKNSKEVFIPITVGGAIKNINDGKDLLYAGADKLAINTGIVINPLLINQLASAFGSQCVVASIQVRKSFERNNWDVMIESGREKTNKKLLDWIEEVQDRGAGEIFLTSVDKDGTAKGPDLDLISYVSKFVKVPLVIGGGISNTKDIDSIFAIDKQISGISIGYAFHKELLRPKEIKNSLKVNLLEVNENNEKTIEILSERKSVVVIDYGMGNVQSLCNAINKIGAKSILTSEPDLYDDASFWALPGVGAFPEGMKRLKNMNLVDKLRERSASNKGIIGICLGMQLLFEESEEYGLTKGIGIFEGNVTKLPEEDQILPHVGWNKLFKTQNKNFLIDKIDDDFYQYFVHSFAVKNINEKDKFSLYDFKFGGENFIAASKKLNTYGFQFHPERSGQMGLNLLSEVIQNF
tara:strand:- start:162 stop:1583 length:1422 start_codon:yes stop_codon:yes gene_type:complete